MLIIALILFVLYMVICEMLSNFLDGEYTVVKWSFVFLLSIGYVFVMLYLSTEGKWL